MAVTRYSKKRESILECLRGTQSHPNAEWVYTRLKPTFPDLSLATVYRNLEQLRQEGLIRSVGIVRGQERFDGCAAPHMHAVCCQCGRVMDAADVRLPADLIARVQEATGYVLSDSDVRMTGICSACRGAADAIKDSQ